MPDKRRDGAFSKPQIVGDAGKAVAQHVCREIWYGSVAEDLITVVREAAESFRSPHAGKHIYAAHQLLSRLK